MATFTSGLKYEPINVPDENGIDVKLGTAIYDLDDYIIRDKLFRFKDRFIPILEKYEELVNELKENKSIDEFGIPTNILETSSTLIEFVDNLINEIDEIFGKGWCDKSSGNSCNPIFIMDIIGWIMNDYGIKAEKTEKEMSKYINREQRRASSKAKK